MVVCILFSAKVPPGGTVGWLVGSLFSPAFLSDDGVRCPALGLARFLPIAAAAEGEELDAIQRLISCAESSISSRRSIQAFELRTLHNERVSVDEGVKMWSGKSLFLLPPGAALVGLVFFIIRVTPLTDKGTWMIRHPVLVACTPWFINNLLSIIDRGERRE